MIILNFSHPLTDAQRIQIETITQQSIVDVLDISVQFDNTKNYPDQIRELLNHLGIPAQKWQTIPVLINPPGYTPAALTLIAELHGRVGYFPAIIRVRPIPDSTPTVYEVAEIINLQSVRETARLKRRE